MLLLVGVLGFFTLIIIMAKLGRASAGSDPNLDPLLNPNIRVGKNWWQASIASSIFLFVTQLSLCTSRTVNYEFSSIEGAVYPNLNGERERHFTCLENMASGQTRTFEGDTGKMSNVTNVMHLDKGLCIYCLMKLVIGRGSIYFFCVS